MQVKVLGTGCPKCKKLYAETEKAIAASGVGAELSKVEKLNEIMDYGVMMTPALVVDGKVVSCGRLPSSAEIVGWIKSAEGKGDVNA